MNSDRSELCALPLRCGAKQAAWIQTGTIRFEHSFRDLCQSNHCGQYGRNWCCPPAVGTPEELERMVLGYRFLLLWSSVGQLTDPFDAEGMTFARRRHAALNDEILSHFDRLRPGAERILMGAGACERCARCTIQEEAPCRYPNKKVLPLEACCIDVTALARSGGMRYNHGENTVTYFGGILFDQSATEQGKE